VSMKRRSHSDVLKEKGLRIACEGTVKKISDSSYLVRTNPAEPWREVVWDGQSWQCQCRFNSNHQSTCKHIYAVLFTRVLNSFGDGENTCPDCGSDDLVRKGLRKNKSSMAQRYYCRTCGLNFIDRPGFYKMKGNARSIVASIDLYFKGLSLSKIQDHLRAFYGVKVTRPAILSWIHGYVKLLDSYLSKLHPKLSKTWHAGETKLNVNGQHQQLWNMLDNGTRFLIANHLTLRRRGQDAKRLIKKALATSISPPVSDNRRPILLRTCDTRHAKEGWKTCQAYSKGWLGGRSKQHHRKLSWNTERAQ